MKQNGINYKFIASLFSFLFSFACITVTTFAWFAIGDSANVTDLEFGIRAEDKIDVGVRINNEADAKKYGVMPGEIYYPKNSSLSDLELLDLSLINSNRAFTPVSSVYQSEWEGIKDFPELKKLPTVDNNGGTAVASNGFYQVEFYFKATENMFLYLDEKTTVNANIEKNQEVARNSSELTQLNKVSESLRIGLYVDNKFTIYEPNVATASNTPLFGKLDILDADGFYDFARGSDEYGHEILFGEYKYPEQIVYGEPTIITDQKAHHIDCFTAETFSGIAPIDVEASISNGIEGAIQKTKTLSEMSTKNSENSNALIYLKKQVDERIVITIWAEGWDVDCTSQISRSSFIINLVFGGSYGKQNTALQSS